MVDTIGLSTGADSELRGLMNLIMPVLECMYAMITCVIVQDANTMTRQELIDRSFQLVRRVSSDLRNESMLGFDRRFFESFLEQLVNSGLIQTNAEETVEPSSRLVVIQRRSSIAVDATFRTRLQNYLEEHR